MASERRGYEIHKLIRNFGFKNQIYLIHFLFILLNHI